MSRLEVRGLSKSYAGMPAVTGVSHVFADGEITTIVGPSGSGKSTTLWMIAGLTAPDAGTVLVDGADVTEVPAERREIGMVFQSYALFPHLSVRENVEFGLRVRRVPRAQRRALAVDALRLVRLESFGERRIRELSGGEQQRVALARALAYRPKVLLMDEPLSALDAKLREQLRMELAALLQELKITTVYVTHDQVEAMSLGRELVVVHAGRVEQSGAPREVYRRPANAFVANFLGSANIFEAVCSKRAAGSVIELPFAEIPAPEGAPRGECWAMVRPEDVEISSNGAGTIPCEFEAMFFLGNQCRLRVRVGPWSLLADAPNHFTMAEGTRLSLAVRPGKVVVWPRQIGNGPSP
ncbi:MAG TPA: ABC transporter ATP-binding protein [Thermoanaerobaculia bacterium]|nr:ABC transporter ATP-binding protein [Thermoanaerobaculia bacterium]